MADITCPSINSQISLDEYLDYLKSSVDVHDTDNLMDGADALKALSNNKSLVSDAINARVSALLHALKRNMNTQNIPYTPASLILADEKDFYLRANIWLPDALAGPMKPQREKVFSIELPHNHNFTFMTVGYFGDGYKTDTYELDLNKMRGKIGEKVHLSNHKHIQLTPGKIILFRPFVDMHTQHAPSSLSISVNMVVKNKEDNIKPQYIFDLETQTITGLPDSLFYTRRRKFLEMAAMLGDEDTFDLIEDIGRRNIQGLSNYAKTLVAHNLATI